MPQKIQPALLLSAFAVNGASALTSPVLAVPRQAWTSLNASVSGRLHIATPAGLPCFTGYNIAWGLEPNVPNAEQCQKVESGLTSSIDIIQTFGSYHNPTFSTCMARDERCTLSANGPKGIANGTCFQGTAPDYYVDARDVQDVQRSLESAGVNTFAIWTHNIAPEPEIDENFTPEGCPSPVGPVVTYGAGQIDTHLYDSLKGMVVVVVESGVATGDAPNAMVLRQPAQHLDQELDLEGVLEKPDEQNPKVLDLVPDATVLYRDADEPSGYVYSAPLCGLLTYPPELIAELKKLAMTSWRELLPINQVILATHLWIDIQDSEDLELEKFAKSKSSQPTAAVPNVRLGDMILHFGHWHGWTDYLGLSEHPHPFRFTQRACATDLVEQQRGTSTYDLDEEKIKNPMLQVGTTIPGVDANERIRIFPCCMPGFKGLYLVYALFTIPTYLPYSK
ncbi:hypothetical protein TgHK011_002857 [Trichoderma gracile]|nr:hypothetical protein TgHK011_002857 [Trichoderma gracile]